MVLQRKRSYGRLQHTQGLGLCLSLGSVTNANVAGPATLSDLVATICASNTKENGNDGGDHALGQTAVLYTKQASLLPTHTA